MLHIEGAAFAGGEEKGEAKGVIRKGCLSAPEGVLEPTSKHSLPLRNSLVSKNAQVLARLPEGRSQLTTQEKRPPTTVKQKQRSDAAYITFPNIQIHPTARKHVDTAALSLCGKPNAVPFSKASMKSLSSQSRDFIGYRTA